MDSLTFFFRCQLCRYRSIVQFVHFSSFLMLHFIFHVWEIFPSCFHFLRKSLVFFPPSSLSVSIISSSSVFNLTLYVLFNFGYIFFYLICFDYVCHFFLLFISFQRSDYFFSPPHPYHKISFLYQYFSLSVSCLSPSLESFGKVIRTLFFLYFLCWY